MGFFTAPETQSSEKMSSNLDITRLSNESQRLYKREIALRRQLNAIKEFQAQDPKTKKLVSYYDSQLKTREAKIDKTILTLENRRDTKTRRLEIEIADIERQRDAFVERKNAEITALKQTQEAIESEFNGKIDAFNDDPTVAHWTRQIEMIECPDWDKTPKTKKEIEIELELQHLRKEQGRISQETEEIAENMSWLINDRIRSEKEREERLRLERERYEQKLRDEAVIAAKMEQHFKEEEKRLERMRLQAAAEAAKQQQEFDDACELNARKVASERKRLLELRKTIKGDERDDIDDALGFLTLIEREGFTPDAMAAGMKRIKECLPTSIQTCA